jgi:hypothetical protein
LPPALAWLPDVVRLVLPFRPVRLVLPFRPVRLVVPLRPVPPARPEPFVRLVPFVRLAALPCPGRLAPSRERAALLGARVAMMLTVITNTRQT